MKRCGHLIEKIVAFENFLLAAKKSLKGKKYKNPALVFYFNLENEIIALQEELRSKSYIPRPLEIFYIREPKVRKIGAAEFRDCVVHHAICNILEPIFERSYIYHSYACRKEKGTHRAVKQAQNYCRQYEYFLKGDIKKYFESIDHQVLKQVLRNRFKDPELLWLLDTIIDSGSESEKGIPIGNLTSQHFANFFLDKLDHYIKDVLQVKGYLRYMDDFILYGDEKKELHLLKAMISDFLSGTLRLQLKEKASLIAPCGSGVPFLGFRIFPGIIRMRNENKQRWLKKLKLKVKNFEMGLIDEVKYADSLRSMTEHIKIANTYHFRRKILNGI
jgi:RNA-directed DNA polymerase